MPTPPWLTVPSEAIIAFERRHSNSEAGALLLWATASVDALYYLADVDTAYDRTRVAPPGHTGDVIDVAHARWAAGTSITALDLCVAGLARSLAGHSGSKELDLGSFAGGNVSKRIRAVVAAMPQPARQWIEDVLADARFAEVLEARHALTHRRLPRHLYLSAGPGPTRRLDLSIRDQQVPVRKIVEDSRDLAFEMVSQLLADLHRF